MKARVAAFVFLGAAACADEVASTRPSALSPPPATCGPGTVLVGAECRPDPATTTRYEVRAASQLAADATARNRVVVLGTRADGSPAVGDVVVLTTDRPGAGAFTPPQVVLGPLGATADFVACDRSIPGCEGPVGLLVALAETPTTPRARLRAELVDPALVNPAAACLGGGDVLHMVGDDEILTGEITIDEATWEFPRGFNEEVVVRVTPPSSADAWTLRFNAKRMPYGQLLPHLFSDAVKAYDLSELQEPIDHPGMDISGFGHACDTVSGSFQVIEYETTNVHVVTRATIAFEQFCNGSETARVSGCLHYEQ
jgi:hypothetical protein